MGFNPLANRPAATNAAPKPKAKTAAEALAELLKQKMSTPAQGSPAQSSPVNYGLNAVPKLAPRPAPKQQQTLASSLLKYQSPDQNIGGFDKTLSAYTPPGQTANVNDMAESNLKNYFKSKAPNGTIQQAVGTPATGQQAVGRPATIQQEEKPAPPPKPNYGQAATNTATNYIANQLDDMVTGSTPAATSATESGIASSSSSIPLVDPSTVSSAYSPLVDPSTVSSGFTPAATSSSGYPLTEAVLQGGDAATLTTPVSTTAGNMFGVMGGLGPTLGLAGQAYYYGQQGLDAYKKMQTAREGAKGQIKAALLSTGPFAGWLAPAVDYLPISSGKHKDQYKRDAARDRMAELGMIDGDKYLLENADGSTFDIGADGSVKNYNLDLEAEGMSDKIGKAQAIAALITGGDPKLTSDITGYLVNAASSSGDFDENLLGYAAKGGLDHATAYAGINDLAAMEDDPIERERADAYLNALDQLFGVGAYGSPSGSASSGGRKKSKGSSKDKSEAPAPAPVIPVAPTPEAPPPPKQTAEPVSTQDYVAAINAVNEANSVSKERETKKKKSNPLSNGFYS